MMLRLGFEGLGLHRIVARIDERNEPSVRLARRLGVGLGMRLARRLGVGLGMRLARRQEACLVRNEFFKGEWSTQPASHLTSARRLFQVEVAGCLSG